MTDIQRFFAPGPWVTRDLKECVLASDYDALAAERDALRKDAERYHRVMQVIRSLCAAKTPELLADLDAAMGEKQ